MSTTGTGPFAVMLLTSDMGFVDFVGERGADKWTRSAAGELTLRHIHEDQVTVTVYPPPAWFGLTYTERGRP